MDLILPELLKGVLLPAAATALVLAAGALIFARRPGAAMVTTPLALLCGFASAFIVIDGELPSIPPAEFWKWTLYLAIPLAVLGGLCDGSRLPHWGKAVALLAVGFVFAAGVVPNFESLAESRNVWRLASIALFVAVSFGAMWGLKDSDPRTAAIMLATVFGGAGGCLALAHTARFAQLCGVLASCAGGGFAIALWRRQAFAVASAIVLLTGIHLAIALVAMFYDAGDVPHAGFLCTGIAPAGIAFSRLIIRGRLRGFPRGVVLLLGGLFPLALAAAIAWSGAADGGSGSGYDYEGLYD